MRLLLKQVGEEHLARKILWISERDGDGAGYDIRNSFGFGRADRLIEVKTTNGWESTPFNISRNMLEVAENGLERWHLVRLWNFARQPAAYEVRPPLDTPVTLTPRAFKPYPFVAKMQRMPPGDSLNAGSDAEWGLDLHQVVVACPFGQDLSRCDDHRRGYSHGILAR